MRGVPSFNDQWFKEAERNEVEELYKGKPEHKAAIEHWRKLHPTKGKKTSKPAAEKEEND